MQCAVLCAAGCRREGTLYISDKRKAVRMAGTEEPRTFHPSLEEWKDLPRFKKHKINC